MLIHHVSILVKDFAAAKAFYTPLMEVFGYKPLHDFPDTYIGYVHEKKGYAEGSFGLSPSRTDHANNQHIGFSAESREQVEAFHKKALELGAKCNGPPGLRPQYGPTYYASFAIDADGNNIEAVYLGDA